VDDLDGLVAEELVVIDKVGSDEIEFDDRVSILSEMEEIPVLLVILGRDEIVAGKLLNVELSADPVPFLTYTLKRLPAPQ
jgi:hypothetical protein